MELYEAIKERRSIRHFTEDQVPAELLAKLVEAAQWAPSWAHTQCVEIIVVDDPSAKAALQASMTEKNPAYKAIVAAPLALAFCGKKGRAGFKQGEAATPRGDWGVFDVALAMQNFMLAAHAEGLATVCIGLFDSAVAAKALGVPDDVDVVALTPLGYATDQEVNTPPRKDVGKFLHKNSYGG